MRRNVIKNLGLTPDRLRELYAEHTGVEIAAQLGVTDAAISYFRRKWGIKKVTARQRAQQGRQGLRLEDVTPVKLVELYTQMGDREVAKLYGVSAPTIRALRRRWGIKPIDKTTRATNTEGLTHEQKETIIGTLLGDAHLTDRGVLRVWHGYLQLSYLQRIHQILGPIAKSLSYSEKWLKGTLTFAFGFRTVQHTWLRSLRDIFYPEGPRVYPESILKELAPRSLAFWYFDDGSLGDGLPSIALGDISDLAAYEVVRLVGERFSLDTYLSPRSAPTCKVLAVRARSADAFFFLVRDFVTPDLLYKLPPKHWPQGVVPTYPAKTEGEVQVSKELKDRCRDWASLGESEQESLVEELVNFWRSVGFPHPKPRPEELQILSRLDESHVIQEGAVKARQVGQTVCHSFCPHIWAGHSYGATHSPLDLFGDDATLRKVIRFDLDAGHVPSASRLRGALRLYKRTGVYNFRPSAAKALTDRFCRLGGTVFDPCGGYGGRLLGVLLSKAQPRYVACEPNTASFEGLRQLHQWMTTYVPELGARCEVYCAPAEGHEFPSEVDMVFTSPPYWKREVYSDEPTQSSHRYPTYEAWLDCFWKPVLDKSVRALKQGGWLVVCVDDFELGGRGYSLVEDTQKIVATLGLGRPELLRYEMPGGGNIEDNHEKVLCWCRGLALPAQKDGQTPLSFYSCRECGKVFPSEHLRGGVCLSCLEPKGSPQTCEGCGKTFIARRRDQRFHDPNCYARHRRREARKDNPPKATRIFICSACGKPWETSELGNFSRCPSCREAQEVARRTKVCSYRGCEKKFVDTSLKNSMSYCCPAHRRREKLFRLGLAKDESYFRVEKDTGWYKCQQCGERFKRESGKSVRCPSCLESNRRKDCRQCGQRFQDESPKNTRRFCHACQTTGDARARVSGRMGEARRGRVRRKEGGRLDIFLSLKPLSQTWWGRVGEVLFLHAYPDAVDAIEEYGNRSPFDAQHRELGRVSVKTARAKDTSHGRPFWSFQIAGTNRNSDTAFLIGLSATRDHVEQVWLIPSQELPYRFKVLSPGSQEYVGLPWERRDLVSVLDRKLQSILSSTAKADPPVQEDSRVEYERNILGRIGEAVYKRLYPLSTHVAGTDPLAPLDFRDPDGTSVNVRLRRRTGRDRWTFFRSSSPVDDYFFVGLDPGGRAVEALLRVPSKEMPAHGFSVRPTGTSKWDAFRKTPFPLPAPVADFVGLPDLEATHVRITSLTCEAVQGMSPTEVEGLLDQAIRYHRFLGFPFPAVPSDKRLASDIQRLRAYAPRGKDLPVENAGLGTCSAYMPHRFEARNNDADFSALGAFEDDARLRRALQFCLRGRAPNLTRRGLRSVLTALNRTPTSFRPAVAKALVEAYSPEGGLVLDPCAGWGGRLMGTLVAGRSYLGVDPDKRTANALFRLGSRICEYLHLDRNLVRVVEGPIQSIPKSLAEATFALTSPPYWVKEVYDEASGTQPLEEWFRDFLCPMFEVTAGLLTEGAFFAVNVSDVTIRGERVALEQLTLEAAKLSGFRLDGTWRMLKSSFGKQPEGRFEPIFVFRK